MSTFVALFASALAYSGIVALVAVGVAILYNATGVYNFAHGDLMTLGAYLAYGVNTDWGVPPAAAFGIAVPAMFVVGVLMERLAFAPLRGRPPIVVLISTLAFGTIIQGIIEIWLGPTERDLASPVQSKAWHLFGAVITYQRVLILVVAAIVIVATGFVFERTAIGRRVRATADDRETAQLMGIRIRRISLFAFGISAALAGLAGILVAPLGSLDLNLGFGIMLTAFAAVILGGHGSVKGIVVASLALGFVQQLLGGYVFQSYNTVLPLILMVIAVGIRPYGLLRGGSRVRV
jgi:branched-chain amino acid transport system permease protein